MHPTKCIILFSSQLLHHLFIQSQSYWSKSIALTCADTDLHCSSGHYYYFILCMRLETCRGLSPKEKSTPSATISPSPYYEVQALQFPLSALGRLISTSASPLHQVLNSNSIIHTLYSYQVSTLPHQMALRLSTPPFSSFSNTPRFLTRTILTQQQQQPLHHHIRPSTRSFSTSPPNMAIKTYFDVSWCGPVLDANSRVTKEVKGEITLLHPRLLPAIERNPSKLQHSPP